MDEEKESKAGPIVEKCIKELSLAIKTMGIYPSAHPAIKASVERLYATMEGVLEASPEFKLEIAQKNLLVDGQLLDKTNEIFRDFALQFHRRGVASITFKKDLNAEELRMFLEVASTEPKMLQKSGGFLRLCQEGKISHIDIVEIDYQKVLGVGEEIGEVAETGKVRSDEEIWIDLIRSLDLYSGLKLGEVEHNFLLHLEEEPDKMVAYLEGVASKGSLGMSNLGGVAVRKTINSIGSYIFKNLPQEKEVHRKKLAEVVSHLNPKLRIQLIDAEIDIEPGQIDVVTEIIPDLSNYVIVEMMTLAVSGEGRVTERLVNLFHKIVPEEERKREIIPLFGDSLADMSGKEDPLYMRRLIENLFLSKPTEEFVSEMYRKALKELNEQISSISGIKEYTDSLNERKIEEQALTVLMDLIRLETESSDYVEIAKNLGKAGMDFLLTGRYEKAKEIIEVLIEEAGPEKGRTDGERNACKEALEKLRDIGIVHDLVTALRDWGREKHETIHFILLHMGEIAVVPLLEALGRETDSSLRKKIISVIVGLGEEAIPEIVRRFSDKNWYVVRNMVRILREIGMEKAVRYLDIPLKHKDPRVRKEVVYALSSIGGGEALRLISLMTDDPDGEVRRGAIKYLGVMRNKESVPLLMKLIAQRNPFGHKNYLIISGIEALGEIGAGEAVPGLVRLLRKSTIFARSRNDEVRIAVATALEKIGNEQAMEALAQGTKYRRKIVRQMCERLIRKHGVVRSS
ncbi:MAG TPA: HEAT repeat domain-containing protein [bacterium]|nr:HEAT repeat domain-containing protein [bacterium]